MEICYNSTGSNDRNRTGNNGFKPQQGGIREDSGDNAASDVMRSSEQVVAGTLQGFHHLRF